MRAVMGLRYRRSFRYHHHHTDPPVLQLSRGGIIGPDAYSDDAIRVLANDLTVAKGTVAVNRSRFPLGSANVLPRHFDIRH